ncbi:MAG: hypothetical protein JWO60_94, partial [Frankiales bacterium]|nr:hypothetical protein [Frankiales bacterium]
MPDPSTDVTRRSLLRGALAGAAGLTVCRAVPS